jgi:hypothetical protein
VRMTKRNLMRVLVVALIVVASWWFWYNSAEQKLQRCIKAESNAYYASSEGQELHRKGTDPPVGLFILECNQMGIK